MEVSVHLTTIATNCKNTSHTLWSNLTNNSWFISLALQCFDAIGWAAVKSCFNNVQSSRTCLNWTNIKKYQKSKATHSWLHWLSNYKILQRNTLTQLASALCAEILLMVTPKANDWPGIDMSSSYRKCISLMCNYKTIQSLNQVQEPCTAKMYVSHRYQQTQ